MDTYFFEQPFKALWKGFSVFITFLSGIFLKGFSVSVILPTACVYLFSNLYDYFEIAFYKEEKIPKIRLYSLVIFFVMLLVAILIFIVFTSDNNNIKQYVEKFYWVLYLVCVPEWLIPLIDGFRGQKDKIMKVSNINDRKFKSDDAYKVMKNTIIKQ